MDNKEPSAEEWLNKNFGKEIHQGFHEYSKIKVREELINLREEILLIGEIHINNDRSMGWLKHETKTLKIIDNRIKE